MECPSNLRLCPPCKPDYSDLHMLCHRVPGLPSSLDLPSTRRSPTVTYTFHNTPATRRWCHLMPDPDPLQQLSRVIPSLGRRTPPVGRPPADRSPRIWRIWERRSMRGRRGRSGRVPLWSRGWWTRIYCSSHARWSCSLICSHLKLMKWKWCFRAH